MNPRRNGRAGWALALGLGWVGGAMAAEPPSPPPDGELVAAWRVRVGGDARTHRLAISAATTNPDGQWNVTAAYGWTYAGQLPVAVSAWAADDGLSLDFVTPAGARIRATRRARDVFEGTLVAPTGATRAVRIERMSAAEANAELEAEKRAHAAQTLIPPGQDVPPACAFFWGGWGGVWNGRAVRLWVVAVDAACGVRYAFRWSDSMDVPATFGTASIADGVLTVPCSTGRCAFARHGETLWSGYSDLHVLVNRPGGAVLERIR